MTRTRVNIIAIAVVSAALLFYAINQLVLSVVRDAGYPLTLPLEETGGLTANKQVTVNGVIVGEVTSLSLTNTGVDARLRIDPGKEIPTNSQVVVLRRSVIGEHAVDFLPRGEPQDFYEPGDRIEAGSVTTPPKIEPLLSLVESRVKNVDPEQFGALTAELADTVRGRRDDIGTLISDATTFSEALAENEAAFDRLFATLRPVTAELAANREAVAGVFAETASAVEALGAIRSDLERLLTEAPPVLTEFGETSQQAGPDIGCLNRDLAATATYLNAPPRRANIEKTLRFNQWFFRGVDVGGPIFEPTGAPWARVRLLLPPRQPPAESYLPEKRPIEEILPGGACAHPLGRGAPAATQPGWAKVIPEAEVVPPPNARVNRVAFAERDGAAGPQPEDEDDRDRQVAAADDAEAGTLPATGPAVVPLAGLALLGAGAALATRLRAQR